MEVTGRKIALGLIGVALASAGVFSAIIMLHSKDYCISERRFLTDMEMYKAALQASPIADIPETRQVIEVETPDGKRGGLYLDDPSGRIQASFPSRIATLAKSSEFLRECCSRTPAWEGGDYAPPTLLGVLRGASPRGVYLNFTKVVVRPEALSPSPRLEGRMWYTNTDKLRITGPVVQSRSYRTRVEVDVCGNAIGNKSKA